MVLNKKLKNDFPIFKTYPDLTYLDSAATSQKPFKVINTVTDFYIRSNSNIHRGIYSLSDRATEIYEGTRAKVAGFIGATNPKEIVFTANASEAVNLIALGYAKKLLKRGDIVVTTIAEHHSNFVPWLELKKKGVKLFILPLTKDYRLDLAQLVKSGLAKERIKLITLNHASNVTGTVNPVNEIASFLKEKKIKAKVVVDGAQSVPHLPVDVKSLGCDFFVFSSHKMLGPAGVGVLWAKEELLEKTEPVFVGSHMISRVTRSKAHWAEIPDRFEVGTGRLEAVAGLGAAVDYLTSIGMKNVQQYEAKLTEYALTQLTKIKDVTVYGSLNSKNRLGVISFAVKGIHPHDISEILNRDNIAIRVGHHCAQPLMYYLKIQAAARASLYIYNNKDDIGRLIEGIKKTKKILING